MSEARHSLDWQMIYFARALNLGAMPLESLFLTAPGEMHERVIMAKLREVARDHAEVEEIEGNDKIVILGYVSELRRNSWSPGHIFMRRGPICRIGHLYFLDKPMQPKEFWDRVKTMIRDEFPPIGPFEGVRMKVWIF
jgi:hypothetical protein